MKAQLSKELLQDLYVSQQMSIPRISEQTGYAYSSIERWFKKWHIPIRSRSESARLRPGEFHPNEQETRAQHRRAYLKELRQTHKAHAKRLNDYETIKLRHLTVIQGLGGRCQICNSQTGLILHHLTYESENHHLESMVTLREAENNATNFAALCRPCHRTLHEMQRNPARLTRLIQLIAQSRTCP